jgi:hypothetical protein
VLILSLLVKALFAARIAKPYKDFFLPETSCTNGHLKGRYEEAIAAFQEGLKLRSDYTHCLGLLGHAYAVSARQSKRERYWIK